MILKDRIAIRIEALKAQQSNYQRIKERSDEIVADKFTALILHIDHEIYFLEEITDQLN